MPPRALDSNADLHLSVLFTGQGCHAFERSFVDSFETPRAIFAHDFVGFDESHIMDV
jgi:hypothetical protein